MDMFASLRETMATLHAEKIVSEIVRQALHVDITCQMRECLYQMFVCTKHLPGTQAQLILKIEQSKQD